MSAVRALRAIQIHVVRIVDARPEAFQLRTSPGVRERRRVEIADRLIGHGTRIDVPVGLNGEPLPREIAMPMPDLARFRIIDAHVAALKN